MKKYLLYGIVLLAAVAAVALYFYTQKQPVAQTDEQQVRAVVQEFGARFKNVSLTAAPEVTAQAIREQYSPFISADLLDFWIKNPQAAPGRLTSSTQPDHIEILQITREQDGAFDVQGKVIEVTNAEMAQRGLSAGTYPVALKLRQRESRWIITGFSKAIPVPTL